MTGGAGFIGSHLVETLLENYSVLVIDDFSSGSTLNLRAVRNHKHLRVAKGNICDDSLIRNALKNSKAVFHLAAKVSVPRSVKNPILSNDVNVNGTLKLLTAAVRNRVQRFVYSSSSSVYGELGALPKSEQMRPQPISPYGVSKLSAENYCMAFYETYGLETVALRYFNVYGPRQRLGPYAGVITSFIERVTNGKRPILFGDGRQTRDFTFVSDVVQANLLALKSNNAAGKTFNIGTGVSTSIASLAKTVLDLSGRRSLGVTKKPARQSDIRHSCADIGKSRRLLGYASKVELRDGLKLVIDWMTQEGTVERSGIG